MLVPHRASVYILLLLFQRNLSMDCHVTMICWYCLPWDGLGRSLRTWCYGGGGIRVVSYRCHLGVVGGSDSSCQMSSLSPPPPDRGELCGLLVLQLQQKLQSTKDKQRAIQCMPVSSSDSPTKPSP